MSETEPIEAGGPVGPVVRPVVVSGARSAEEIRADLAHCDRDGVPWPEAARRLLADVPSLLAEVERSSASRDEFARTAIANNLALADAAAERDRLRGVVQAVREQAEEWRSVTPAAFYPEASAAADAIENCGDALLDLLTDSLAAAADAPQPIPEADNIARCEHLTDDGRRCIKWDDHIEGFGGDTEHRYEPGLSPAVAPEASS